MRVKESVAKVNMRTLREAGRRVKEERGLLLAPEMPTRVACGGGYIDLVQIFDTDAT